MIFFDRFALAIPRGFVGFPGQFSAFPGSRSSMDRIEVS